MSYKLQYDPITVEPFLRSYEGLSRAGRIRLNMLLLSYLGEEGDRFLENPALRLAPGSDLFTFEPILQDPPGVGPLIMLRFIVNDSAAQYGILRILFVEEVSRSAPP